MPPAHYDLGSAARADALAVCHLFASEFEEGT
jgi:hypothetical protein